MKFTEQQILELNFALSRLKNLDICPRLRVLISRNFLVINPLAEIIRETFPKPKDPKAPTPEEIAAGEAWTKELKERVQEGVAVVMIPFIPEFDDRLFAAELRAGRDAKANQLSDEGIDAYRNARNQALTEALLPLIQEPAG